MISSSVFEDSIVSMAAAERADLVEALLRGELSREDYETMLLTNRNQENNGKRNENPPADGRRCC
jgi:hypothetical protein